MHFKKFVALAALFALAFNVPLAVADNHEKTDGLARVALITPKDGKEKALEEAITKYHHYMADKKGSWRYSWYSILTGPNTGKYIARSGNHNWEDFDATHDWDEEAGARFEKDVAPFIEDVHVTITRWDDEISHWPESMDGYEYFSLTQWRIKQGHGEAFNEGLKKIHKNLQEGGWPNYYGFVYPVSGGYGNSLTIVSPRKNFADMAPKEPKFMDIMSKAMGEEEARSFMSDWSQTYKSGQNELVKYRKDLSDYGE